MRGQSWTLRAAPEQGRESERDGRPLRRGRPWARLDGKMSPAWRGSAASNMASATSGASPCFSA
jgi:hypothetical protein